MMPVHVLSYLSRPWDFVLVLFPVSWFFAIAGTHFGLFLIIDVDEGSGTYHGDMAAVGFGLVVRL